MDPGGHLPRRISSTFVALAEAHDGEHQPATAAALSEVRVVFGTGEVGNGRATAAGCAVEFADLGEASSIFREWEKIFSHSGKGGGGEMTVYGRMVHQDGERSKCSTAATGPRPLATRVNQRTFEVVD